MRREYAIKQLSHAEKLELIQGVRCAISQSGEKSIADA